MCKYENSNNILTIMSGDYSAFKSSRPLDQVMAPNYEEPSSSQQRAVEEYEETKINPNGFFSDTKSAAACSVRVALRVRPLVGRELFESPNICTKCYEPENQLVIGKDRNFTFDKVFDIGTRQQDVFDICVKNLVLGCFQGYNATVLAYGQTGSGKTFTMGSGYTIGIKEQDLGIIPRVIKLIFEEVDKRKNKADIVIKCSFLEIYNEELHDLLEHSANPSNGLIDRFIQKKEIQIREEKNGSISLFGLREDKVASYEELAACLDRGSNFRSTASTLMNNQSSRSHAIFTISIEQSIIEDLYKPDVLPNTSATPAGESNEEYMVAKFHFVDLAGSERAKRTGATGNTLKEGISINKGLLALGNVIAALTEEGKKNHVPYRDSKLTRILQDSLGGNSRTSMIACVSPAEVNFEETLNTLKYASRARNIKNAPKVNRDPNSQQIAQLRQQVFELQRDLQTCKKLLITNNIEFDASSISPLDTMDLPLAGASGRRDSMATSATVQRLENDLKDLRQEKEKSQKRMNALQSQLDQMTFTSNQTQIELFSVKKERDLARFNLEQLISLLRQRGYLDSLLQELTQSKHLSEQSMELETPNPSNDTLELLLSGTNTGILEEYQMKLNEAEKECTRREQQVKNLQRDYEMLMESSERDVKSLEAKQQEVERLRMQVQQMQREQAQAGRRSGQTAQNKTNNSNVYTGSTFGAAAAIRKSNLQKSLTKKAAQTSKPISNEAIEGLTTEFDNNIEQFNKVFIENLSQQLSVMFGKKPASIGPQLSNEPRSETSPVKQEPDDLEHDQKSDEDMPSAADDDHEDELNNIIDPPKDEREQQQLLEQNEDLKQADEQLRANLQSQEQQIESLEDNLKDKESLLQSIKEQQKLLSTNLLEAMKNEYHKKIAHFQQELLNLEQERADQLRQAESAAVKGRLEESFKKRVKELEDKLNQAKAKEREQQAMMKQSTTHKQKIKSLEGEIEKMRTQRVSLMKRIKEESEQHRKWKQERVKEIMQMKMASVRKDREIQMLKRENVKKDLIAKRKQEEITAMMKKTKTDKAKQVNAEKDRQKKKNIDMEYIQQWIIQNTEKMLKYQDLEQEMLVQQGLKNELDAQIAEEQRISAQLTIKRDKLDFQKAQLESQDEDPYLLEQINQLNHDLMQVEIDIQEAQDNLDSYEAKNEFLNEKIHEISLELMRFSPDSIDQIKFEEVQSIEGARACLTAFFKILLDVNVYKRFLENANTQNQATIEGLNSQLEELRQILHANEVSFQKQIEQINFEFKQKESLILNLIVENEGLDMDQVLAQLSSGDLRLTKTMSDDNTGKASTKKGISIPISNARAEIQKNNQQQYVQSKTALSKRVAELEREKKEDQKKYETIKHKLEQTNAEKEIIKRQLDTIKSKIKQQDIMEVKQSKILPPGAMDDASNTNTLSGQKSPRMTSSGILQFPAVSKMQTLKDARNERKTKKIAGGGYTQREPTNEPRVIADEPMEDDEDVNEHKRVDGSRDSRADNRGDVFSRLLQPAKPRVAQGSLIEQPLTGSAHGSLLIPGEVVNQYEDDHNWKCKTNQENAHSGQICAVASSGNLLYSSSNKSMKIWDLENMKSISDLSAHQGFIRCLIAWQGRSLIVSASEKTIILWDIVSLTPVGTLKAHKEDIRALAVGGPSSTLLYSGGKGSQHGGALLIWDLRKPNAPIEEKEKNLDIFSLATTQTHLFMGCRNHSVYPVNLQTFETQKSFDPPHFDAVTSLATLEDDCLVSGSRDKNLRCWDSQNLQIQYPQQAIMSAHNDWINTLETDHDRRMMYSGSKDGIVKVWKLKNKQLKCSAQLSLPSNGSAVAGSSGINTITKIDKQFGTMFATGGSDRQIRIWKYKEPVGGAGFNGDPDPDNYGDDGAPDVVMVDEHFDRKDFEDDQFEFEDDDGDKNPLPSSMSAIGPDRFKHQSSQKVDDLKHEKLPKARALSRGNSGLIQSAVTPSQQLVNQMPLSMAQATSKLDQRRLEKKMGLSNNQQQARRNYQGHH